jgi:serine/threonine protein kinase
MPAAVRDAIQPGSSVDRYQIVGLLSAGGMGEVYRAIDPALGRELVLKVLSNEAVFRAELLERFIREARAASALNHPNIVTIAKVQRQAQYNRCGEAASEKCSSAATRDSMRVIQAQASLRQQFAKDISEVCDRIES